MATKGRCLCAKLKWEFHGDISWACYCHCDDCRRNCGAPVVAWLGVPREQFNWLSAPPEKYQSSTGVWRYFCGTCGSPLAFEAEHYAGVMHLYAAQLEDPELFQPTFHVNYGSKLGWLSLHDTLSKHNSTLLHTADDLTSHR